MPIWARTVMTTIEETFRGSNYAEAHPAASKGNADFDAHAFAGRGSELSEAVHLVHAFAQMKSPTAQVRMDSLSYGSFGIGFGSGLESLASTFGSGGPLAAASLATFS